MKWLRALGSLAILAGVLFGVPWLLLVLGDPGVLIAVDWGQVLTRPDDGRVLIGLLSVVGWLAWLVLAATIVAELVAVLSRRRIDVAIPGTGWLRPLVASLVAALTLAPALSAAHAAPPDSQPRAPAVAPAVATPQATPDTQPEATGTGRTYTAREGDELWSIAEAHLGSGERWRDLLTVNPGLTPTSRLTEGQELQLPPDVLVGRGDSLWSLAERHLGDPLRWPEIHELNASLVKDPDQIDVGWHLLLPSAEAPPQPAATADGSAVEVRDEGAPSPEDRHEPAVASADAPDESPDAEQAPEGGSAADADSSSAHGPDRSPAGSAELPAPTPAEGSSPEGRPPAARESPSGGETESRTPDAQAPASADAPAPPSTAPEQDDHPPTGSREIAGPETGDAPRNDSSAAPMDDPSRAPTASAAPSVQASTRAGETASSAGSVAPQPAEAGPGAADVESAEDSSEATKVLGPIGGLLAGSLVVGLTARRRLQLVGRALGRRLIPVSPESARFWSALARKGEEQDPQDLDWAPTSVVLGWRADGSEIVHELEAARATVLRGPDDPHAMLSAMLTSLGCAPWSEEVEVFVAGSDTEWAEAIDDPRITQLSSTAEGARHFVKSTAERSLALGPHFLSDLRADPNTAPAWRPQVYLFSEQLAPRDLMSVRDALAFGKVGTCVVAVDAAIDGATSIDMSTQPPRLQGVEFTPQLLEMPARRALVDLFSATLDPDTEPAPWWEEAPNGLAARRAEEACEEPADLTATGSAAAPCPPVRRAAVTTSAPRLILLGEPALLSTAGPPPNRARQQCIEYAAWLLLHPGASPTRMKRALVVAEGTRRSNVSRLRSWLGTAHDDTPFLPDAYDGSLRLAPDVTSDWHELREIVGDSVQAASTSALRDALSLVQGPVLGSAANRWPWAVSLHDDIAAMVVDIGCVLADRAVATGDTREALWALERAELASPGHDEVAIRFVIVHSQAGDAGSTRSAAGRFLEQVRRDNREVLPEHNVALAQAQRRVQAQAPSA